MCSRQIEWAGKQDWRKVPVFNPLKQPSVAQTMAAFIARVRPPESVRDELDVDYALVGRGIEIFEIRTKRFCQQSEKIRHPSARLVHVRSRDVWRLYCMKSDLMWHLYKETTTLDAALRHVELDVDYCFFWPLDGTVKAWYSRT
jgi:hypothetical protein